MPYITPYSDLHDLKWLLIILVICCVLSFNSYYFSYNIELVRHFFANMNIKSCFTLILWFSRFRMGLGNFQYLQVYHNYKIIWCKQSGTHESQWIGVFLRLPSVTLWLVMFVRSSAELRESLLSCWHESSQLKQKTKNERVKAFNCLLRWYDGISQSLKREETRTPPGPFPPKEWDTSQGSGGALHSWGSSHCWGTPNKRVW